MKEIFKKTSKGLIPASAQAQELFDSMPFGAMGFFDFAQDRSPGNHKRFFKFRDATFDMQDCFDNSEIWRKHLIMIAGYYDEVVVFNPTTEETSIQYWPKSMAFDKMKEKEFQKFFKRAITGFLNRYGNGLSEDQILRIVEFD